MSREEKLMAIERWCLPLSMLAAKYASTFARINAWAVGSEKFFTFLGNLQERIDAATISGKLRVREWPSRYILQPPTDSNHDGLIDLQEFCEWACAAGYACPKDAHELAVAFGLQLEASPPVPRASTQPQAERGAPVVAGAASRKPVQRGAAQDDAVLEAIRNAGHDPLALPKNQPGKAGIKACIRAELVGKIPVFPIAGTQFDKAWERLRSRGDIADAP